MSLTMYQASTPVFLRILDNLTAILDKAAAHADTKNIDPAVFINARLAPDMYPLSRQIQIATDMVKACAARLADIDIPSFEDTETTFPELKQRIAKTVAFLQSVSAEQIDGSELKPIHVKTRHRELHFDGQAYLLTYAIPNFYFHVTTAYAILRHNGVDLGKGDFLGSFEKI